MEFEGEYLKGKINGKGKEYDDIFNKLVFESEYLNGKKHGKGREYDYYGDLIFEGEYLYNIYIMSKEKEKYILIKD